MAIFKRLESETVTWAEEKSSKVAMGGGGARSALFCVLISLKRRVRANQLFKRDSVTRFSTSGIFINYFPLSIPLGPFQIFSKIRGDIHSSSCTTGVLDTGGMWKKSPIIKVLIILLTVRSQQPDIVPITVFATGINNTSKTGSKICRRFCWYQWAILPPVSLIPAAILPPVSLTLFWPCIFFNNLQWVLLVKNLY